MGLDIDRHAHVESAIQVWDPRLKIASLGAFALITAMLQTIPVVLFAFAVSVTLLILSKIPMGFVYNAMKWLVVLLLPFFIILPVTYPGEVATEFLGIPYAIEGVRLSVMIVLKAVTVMTTAFVIFGSARFDISMIALQELKCPHVIVQMLLFAYRYIFLFLAEMKRLDTAMKARGFVKKPNLYTMKVVGGFVGTLLIRSFERTERIYKAMLSKGYRGTLHTMVEFEADGKDKMKALAMVVIILLIVGGDLSGLFAEAEQAWF